MTPSSVVPDLSFLLLDKITAGFSPDRLIGIGGFGKVYKGMHNNGEEIAVKVLHDMIGLDDKIFMNEFKNLQMLQHPNIVQLVGCCNETRKKYVHYEGRLVLAEEIKRALCFEYLRNGSLDNYLSDEYSGQDWKTRYAIIKGICLGLKYLHDEASIYHLDLKPANILLGENMEPKIADFGLSRLFGEEKTRITKSQIGTFGYLPPEYIDRNIISNKLDVFSLGVIVIKIITGRDGYNKSDQMPPEDFIRLVQTNWRNRLHEPTESEQIKRCMEIALSCVEIKRCNRPTIGEIVHKLSKMETMFAKLSPQLPHWLKNNLVPQKKEENDPEASMEIKQRHLENETPYYLTQGNTLNGHVSFLRQLTIPPDNFLPVPGASLIDQPNGYLSSSMTDGPGTSFPVTDGVTQGTSSLDHVPSDFFCGLSPIEELLEPQAHLADQCFTQANNEELPNSNYQFDDYEHDGANQ